jgi:hypothetical protein
MLLNRLKWSNVLKRDFIILYMIITLVAQFYFILFAFFGHLDFPNFAFDFYKRISAIQSLHKGGFLPPNRSKTPHIKEKKKKKKKKNFTLQLIFN